MEPLVCIGNSHIVAVANAANAGSLPVFTLHLKEARRKAAGTDQQSQFMEASGKLIAELARSGSERVFAFIGGGTPAVLGLVQHTQPFDFHLPKAPDLPILAGATIVPHDAVLATMATHVRRHLRMLKRLSTLPFNIVQVETPPPVFEAEFLVRTARTYNRDVVSLGVSPAALRWKLWKMHSDLFANFCEGNRIGFMRNPQGVLDKDGFLAQPYWGDFVHGNELYGRALIEEMKGYR